MRNAVILGVATLAALTLVGERPGLGLSIALVAIYVTTLRGVRPLVSPGWWVVAVALAAVAVVRDAGWVVWPALIASVMVASLAGLFLLVLVAGAANRTAWLPRGVVALTAWGMVAFAISNPDGRIAERNVDRWQRTGSIDLDALRGLSADAAPALANLACVAAEPPPDGLAGLNVARPGRARRST